MRLTKRNWFFVGLIIVACALVINFYLTNIWFSGSDYRLSVINSTSVEVERVQIKLTPKGEFDFGGLLPQQSADHMDPPWPLPSSIEVTYRTGSNQVLQTNNVLINAQPGFIGVIQVEITENNGVYNSNVSLIK